MGIIQHDVVIVVCRLEQQELLKEWVKDYKPDARDVLTYIREAYKTMFLFGRPMVNSICTVLLVPDGSKEGWPESSEGDKLRLDFLKYAREIGCQPKIASFGEIGDWLLDKDRYEERPTTVERP